MSRVKLAEDALRNEYPFQILETTNGRQALEMAPQIHPDVIFMDIHMPVMDGHKAALALKASDELWSIPIIALAAYAMEEQRQRFQDVFDAYLTNRFHAGTAFRVGAPFCLISWSLRTIWCRQFLLRNRYGAMSYAGCARFLKRC